MKAMYGKVQKRRDDLKPVERRLNTLDEHIRQTEIYRRYKGKRMLTDSKDILLQAAKRYLADVLNGHKLDLKAWKRERESKIAQKNLLYLEYAKLKELRKSAEASTKLCGAKPRGGRRGIWRCNK